MNTNQFNQALTDFIHQSPTQFHAVASMKAYLDKQGYQELKESERWETKKHTGYYVIRNASSIIAFYTGDADFSKKGIKIACAHTDSPGLKIKPSAEIKKNDFLQLGVEVYGGPILDTWFDRDLSIAGRISYFQDNRCISRLINFESPVAVIPNIAIHLNNKINTERSIAKQKELPPVIALGKKDLVADKNLFLKKLKTLAGIDDESIQPDYELFLYNTQPPAITGINQEFITGARIDNLLSCYAGITALPDGDSDQPALFYASDNEEIGSNSYMGAAGNFIDSVLLRLAGTYEDYAICISKSVLLSSDNAHGLHPSYSEKYDSNHAPLLNSGPVIKYNAAGKYATTSLTSALIKQVARQHAIPLQKFVSRSDMPCGSTIGPVTSARIGIQTLDIGIPMLAMHSIRETAGTQDALLLQTLLTHFFSTDLTLY